MSKGKVLAIIPARYQSSRFPGKAVADLFGMPMVQWVYDKVKKCYAVDETWIATDDKRIEDAVAPFLSRVVMTPSNCENGTERAWAAYKAIRSEFDIILNVQGDEPLIKSEDIEKVIQCFENEQTQIASLYRKLDENENPDDPNLVKVVLKANNEALYFSRSRIPYDRSGNFTTTDFYAHVGIYGFRTKVLEEIMASPSSYLENREMLEQLRWLEAGFSIKMAKTTNKPRGIDTPEQLEILKTEARENPAIMKV